MLAFAWEWLRYTPFFFTHAPIAKWHTYFDSARRMASSMTYAKAELAKCADERERNVQRIQLLDAGMPKGNLRK